MDGNHNIQTDGGQFLSLAGPDDAITLVDVALNANQVWNFELIGGNYTVRNVGQDVFAEVPLGVGGLVADGEPPMNWTLVASGGSFSIRPAANNNLRWNVNDGVVNLLEMAGDLAILDVHRFNIF